MPSHQRFFEESGHLLRDHRLYLPNPSFANPRWETASLRALVVRLSPFRAVDRSTAHLVLARELRRALADCWIDFAFLPQAADRALFEAAGLPLFLGTQSHRSLEEFDLVLVSNACLPELLNLPYLLLRSGVPVWAHARDSRWPPVILGGSNTAAAHAVVAVDGSSMVDALFFGEGEGRVQAIASSFVQSRYGKSKREWLVHAAEGIDGLWPAGDVSRPARRAVASLDLLASHADLGPVLPGPEAATARLEITRGCPCECSFCFEGLDRLPFRAAAAPDLFRDALRLKSSTGAHTVELSSLNFNTHGAIGEIEAGLPRLFQRVNPMSQRVDILARSSGLADLELAADKRTFTLGIEGISSSLRAFLHKSLSETDISRALEVLHRRGVRELKLFYLVTGHEQEEDFAEFTSFVRDLKSLRGRAEAQPRLLFSFGMLVRMPFTPLRHDSFPVAEADWRRIIGRVKSTCETHGFEFRLAMGWLDWLFSQLLALGGRRAYGLLELLAEAGICWDGALPAKARGLIEDWMRREGITPDELGAEKPADALFGLPYLEGGPSPRLLWERFRKAKARKDEGYCRRGSGPGDPCVDCPACTLTKRSGRGEAARPLASKARAVDAETTRWTGELSVIMRAKRKLPPLLFEAQVPPEAARLGPEWLDAWLLRRLLQSVPALADNVLSVHEELVRTWYGDRFESPWSGRTVVSVRCWDSHKVLEAIPAGAWFGPAYGFPQAKGFPDLSLSLKIELPRRLFPDARSRLGAWLRQAKVPATVLRSRTEWRLALSPSYLRKKALLSGSYRETDDGLELSLEVGKRLALSRLLAALADDPRKARRALVEVVAISR